MAQLPTNSLNVIWSNLMSEFSSVWTLIPITKDELKSLLGLIDEQLESAEVSIIQSLPSGEGKTWLVDNQALGREIMIRVLEKRKEVL